MIDTLGMVNPYFGFFPNSINKIQIVLESFNYVIKIIISY